MEASMPRKPKVIAIEPLIRNLRGQQIILDRDLAALYQVPNKNLYQAVKRNADRFPDDFVFRLGNEEFSNLRSQIVTSSGRGGRRDLPLAFTAEVVAMLSGVLQSERAVTVNINIMREFVRLKNLANLRDAVVRKLDALENRVDGYEVDLQQVSRAIQQILTDQSQPTRKIGFDREQEKAHKRARI
jgi:hypothetical protein